MKRKDKNNKSEKISYSFKYVNLKEYLKKDNFIVLHKLGIEVKKTKCTEYDIKTLKVQLSEYYDIKWLQFITRTDFEEKRLRELEIKRIKKDLNHETTKNIEIAGVNREEFEHIYEVIETLEEAIRIYKIHATKRPKIKQRKDILNIYKRLSIDKVKQAYLLL